MTPDASHREHEPGCGGEIEAQPAALDQTWGELRARLWTCSVCAWRRWEPEADVGERGQGGMSASADATPKAAAFEPAEPVRLSPGDMRRLAAEGVALRREFEAQTAGLSTRIPPIVR